MIKQPAPSTAQPAQARAGMLRPVQSEAELIAIAACLAGPDAALSPAERSLVQSASGVDQRMVAVQAEAAGGRIRCGEDPLGEAFCQLRSPALRRAQGAVYTPAAIVDIMLDWIAEQHCQPARVVDPGAGSGRFIAAAAARFPLSELLAVESDPLAALLLRANARVLGFAHRLRLLVSDYRDVSLPQIQGTTAFIGNPPYVRHHHIDAARKQWLSQAAATLGVKCSQLAGLHIHFFFHTALLARPGDLGCFITAAEWLDVNYGAALRRLFVRRLGGKAIHLLAAEREAFADTATTAVISCFQSGAEAAMIRVQHAREPADLMASRGERLLARATQLQSERWSPLIMGAQSDAGTKTRLGDLFRVHRGQVTGCNRVWIAGPAAAHLPPRWLLPTVTKARELFAAGEALIETGKLRRVVDLPVDLSELPSAELDRIQAFLDWARREAADTGYIARHRRAWWAVGLREPAPILCTYMARRPPAFVHNPCGARHLNIAHGLYPHAPLDEQALLRLVGWLRGNVTLASGRTYAGGLVKFEPREIERIPIPDLESLHAPAEALVAGRFRHQHRTRRPGAAPAGAPGSAGARSRR
jgi:methylase of polypeptide subunit release factors